MSNDFEDPFADLGTPVLVNRVFTLDDLDAIAEAMTKPGIITITEPATMTRVFSRPSVTGAVLEAEERRLRRRDNVQKVRGIPSPDLAGRNCLLVKDPVQGFRDPVPTELAGVAKDLVQLSSEVIDQYIHEVESVAAMPRESADEIRIEWVETDIRTVGVVRPGTPSKLNTFGPIKKPGEVIVPELQLSGKVLPSPPSPLPDLINHHIWPGKGKPIEVYTDGSCLKNPGGPTGWAAIVVVDGKVVAEYGFGAVDGTNNTAELMGAITALENTPVDAHVTVYSDSEYVVKGISEWMPRWVAKDFYGVKNGDLWRRLNELRQGRVVDFKWLRGHTGHVHNEAADKLAGIWSRKFKEQQVV